MAFLLSSTTNFEFPPYFPCFSTFPPCFAKIIISPYYEKFPLFSKNAPAFYILLVYFVFPYFGHDAFMHHPMHVLNSPEFEMTCMDVQKHIKLIFLCAPRFLMRAHSRAQLRGILIMKMFIIIIIVIVIIIIIIIIIIIVVVVLVVVIIIIIIVVVVILISVIIIIIIIIIII